MIPDYWFVKESFLYLIMYNVKSGEGKDSHVNTNPLGVQTYVL